MILATVLMLGVAFLIAAGVVVAQSHSAKTESMPDEKTDQQTSPESAFYYCISQENPATSRGLLLGGVPV